MRTPLRRLGEIYCVHHDSQTQADPREIGVNSNISAELGGFSAASYFKSSPSSHR